MTTLAPLLGEPLPVELMNTVWADRDGVYDALETVGAANEWLRAKDLPTVDGLGLIELTMLRDAVRRLASVTTGDERPSAASAVTTRKAALAILNEATARSPIWSTLEWPAAGEPRKQVSSTGVASVALLAEQAVDLFAGPPKDELRACLAPGCVLYFVRQHPRREWCSAGCGNRARVARHYQRHHA